MTRSYHFLFILFLSIPVLSTEGCLQFNGDGTCSKCSQGFRLNDGKCARKIPFCMEYNED